jgi:hypothetical protein
MSWVVYAIGSSFISYLLSHGKILFPHLTDYEHGAILSKVLCLKTEDRVLKEPNRLYSGNAQILYWLRAYLKSQLVYQNFEVFPCLSR